MRDMAVMNRVCQRDSLYDTNCTTYSMKYNISNYKHLVSQNEDNCFKSKVQVDKR